MSAVASGSFSADRVFYEVGSGLPERMDVISRIFHRVLTPLYGSQEKALGQIERGEDRKSFLLYEREVPVGVLVFKKVLSDEFADLGVSKSVEVKSLFVDNSVQNSGKGLGSCLVDKLQEEVEKLHLGHQSIHVTVSETKQESFNFFQKKGFQVAHEWKDRYVKGVTEYLLKLPAQIVAGVPLRTRSEEFSRFLQRQVLPVVAGWKPSLIHTIVDAHLGDIHALTRLADGTFVSGGKDNSIYQWNRAGERVAVVDEVEPRYSKEQNWITAIGVINDQYWMSGQRSGQISLWKTNGSYVRDITPKLPKLHDHVCSEHNARRVTCLATGLNPLSPSVFVGFPTMFDQFNFMENRTEDSVRVHKNDWVYCIHPLDQESVLTVVGDRIEKWKKQEEKWQLASTLISLGDKEPRGAGKRSQRSFIAAIAPLDSSPHHLGLTSFDGAVRVLDLQTKQVVREWKEHTDKVWSIVNVDRERFATGSEDGLLKFWDVREARSVHTIGDHPGPISALLRLDPELLLAGTCAKDKGANGQILFYDIRR